MLCPKKCASVGLMFGGPTLVVVLAQLGLLPGGWAGPVALATIIASGALAYRCCSGAPASAQPSSSL